MSDDLLATRRVIRTWNHIIYLPTYRNQCEKHSTVSLCSRVRYNMFFFTNIWTCVGDIKEFWHTAEQELISGQRGLRLWKSGPHLLVTIVVFKEGFVILQHATTQYNDAGLYCIWRESGDAALILNLLCAFYTHENDSSSFFIWQLCISLTCFLSTFDLNCCLELLKMN